MKQYLVFGLIFAIAVVLLIVAEVPSKDDFSPDNPLFNGLSQASKIADIQTVTIGSLGSLPPNSTLFIIGPDKAFTEKQADEIRGFLERGGSVVVMDDFGTANSLLMMLGVDTRLNGSLLMDPLYMYRNPALPLVRFNLKGEEMNVYFNYATVLEGTDDGKCIAYSSPFSFLDLNGNGKKDPEEPYGPFCVAESLKNFQGRLIVISDSSVFINSMLDKGDNERLLDALVGNGRAFLLTGLWNQSEYTLIRSSISGGFSALMNTWLLYPFALALLFVGMEVGSILYIHLQMKSRKGYSQEDIEAILRRHPEWKREEIEELLEEMKK
ncbi:MAG: DUF4350 domain-containing protein [Fervidicoccaceae archaeon]